MLSIIGIFLGLALLIYLSYKGWNVVLVSLIASLVVILFSGIPLIETTYSAYMAGFSNWTGNFFLMILGGSLFAKVMDVSGAARSISAWIMKLAGKENTFLIFVGLFLVSGLLVYAGINAWVIVFIMVPIMYPIWKELDLPWHIALALFSMAANGAPNGLPGSVTLYNVMPMTYLGTTSMAGWKLALLYFPFFLILAFGYVFYELRKAKLAGEGFIKPEKLIVQDIDFDSVETPNIILAILPIVVTLVSLNVFQVDVFYALMLGVLTTVVLMYKYIPNLIEALGEGTMSSFQPVFITSAVVGFGAVVAATPGFETITTWILEGIPGSPYVSWMIGVTSLAGVTGSASGGLAMALESLLPAYSGMDLNPEVMHRLATVATLGLDTLPHNGAVATILTIFGLSHKEGYRHMFAISVVLALLQFIPALIGAFLFY